MKVGDRILAINGNDVASCNLMEAVDMLRHSTHNMTSLVVEYDVSYMGASYGISSSIFTRISSICILTEVFLFPEAVEKATGPLLVEIDKASGSSLGLTVTSSVFNNKNVICIDHIQPASIADR